MSEFTRLGDLSRLSVRYIFETCLGVMANYARMIPLSRKLKLFTFANPYWLERQLGRDVLRVIGRGLLPNWDDIMFISLN